MFKSTFCIGFAALIIFHHGSHADNTDTNPDKPALQEIQIWGNAGGASSVDHPSPNSLLTQEDLQAINITTTEDLVKFEPSIVIRRRFIGDANGTLGMRGSNMFQTARSMVFADGVPLHYLLQSRWSGAPRWSMVSASEIAQVEVIYGPFSALHSGNAMGGVVLIETAIPQEREIHVDGALFSQEFAAYGFADQLNGFKGFASYGDKLGPLSYYFSYNRLDNTAQPQTFQDAEYVPAAQEGGLSVNGGIFDNDSLSRPRIWYGDTGPVDSQAEHIKIKLGYDFFDWSALLNIAFEDRNSSTTSANSYIRGASGETLWSADSAEQGGQQFSFDSSELNSSMLDRQSLSAGLRIRGDINDDVVMEANINQFEILQDESRESLLNPSDPSYTDAGQISEYRNSGWRTAEAKLTWGHLRSSGWEFITGVRHEAYELNLDVYDSPDYAAGIKGTNTSRFGGQTVTDAVFAQAEWEINPRWATTFGLRYEHFTSSKGYYDDNDGTSNGIDLVQVPSETKSELSPKLSIAYQKESWLLRYSVAKAFRFPIIEELFRQYQAYNIVARSNPELEPENGLHHNLMIDKSVYHGFIRVNFFQETIKNAIESQTDFSATDARFDVRSFVPIDEVDVLGSELIIEQKGLFADRFDLRFNITWTNAEIVDNQSAEGANTEETIEGNDYPRLPEWRSHLLATYHIQDRWKMSASAQYASDSYGLLDNSDREDHVYGAQDAYTRIGLKTHYQLTHQWGIGVGVDNLTDEIAYVAHPWPGRTFYLNVSFDLKH